MSAPTREPDAVARARAWVTGAGLPAATRLAPLAGDASDRRFVRVAPPAGESRVLVVHTESIDASTLPLIHVADLFRRMSVPVPAVLGVDAALGIVVLEDLGDTTLEEALASLPPGGREARYREAVEIIVAIQDGGRRLAASDAPPFRLAFDAAKLSWELDFFVTEFIERYRSRTPTAATRAALDTELATLAREMAAEPRVLCHRDFHCRNLMVHRDRLHVIDFQDARLGPDSYDLASLLRDAYVTLEPAMVERLTAHFRDRIGVTDDAAWRQRFVRTALQRHLKALGTFGHQIAARGRTRYAAAVPRTLAHVREILERDDRYQRLHALLAPLIAELGS